MKNSVVIVWHNRPKNLDFWLSIITVLDKSETRFTVIHNCEIPDPQVQMRCMAAGAHYLPRANKGFDVGAFQDVCRKRLFGFDGSYEYLLWFTDDCFPMTLDFVQKLTAPLAADPKTAVACLEISSQIKRHIRTTGFCIRRTYAEQIRFPVDPIATKDDCYKFEHRGPNSFYEQTLKSGFKAVQIADVRVSPVWDSGGGGHGWVNRRQEFERTWGKLLNANKIHGTPWSVAGSRVAVICPAFERHPAIVSSMILQTYHNWTMYLVHDGPAPDNYPVPADERIRFITEPGPRKHFGHPIREQYLQKVRDGEIEADYVLVTNDDNYHAPFFLEKLARVLDENPQAPGAYCSAMVHNYQGMPGQVPPPGKSHISDGYGIINVRPERGFIDCAAVLLRAELAGKTGWPDDSHSSDWNYLNAAANAGGGWDKFRIVPGVLLVHN